MGTGYLMGYHIILHCTAIIKPEYIDCIKMENFEYDEYYHGYDSEDSEEEEFEGLPEQWIEFYKIWRDLCLRCCFYQFKLEGDRFTFEISEKFNRYVCRSTHDDLSVAYRRLMRDIIAPISSEILHCEIEHDDYGIGSYYYTDAEVREFWVR
jgi:hypothetical protein